MKRASILGVLFLCFYLLAEGQENKDENRWLQQKIPGKSKGMPVTSAWHTGTAGIIKNDGAELSLINTSRIGLTKSSELLLRIGEEWVMPNIGIKHQWVTSNRLFLASEHMLYCPWPGLYMLQASGYKDLLADSVKIGPGLAMRHELILSWLMNPQVLGCPNPAPERILSFRMGTEFYIGKDRIPPFDWFHSFYHTQILNKKVLYYGGIQFDSYFSNRFHYSINALCYNSDFSSDLALESNVRLTWYAGQCFGISAVCKAAYIRMQKPADVSAFSGNGILFTPREKETWLSILPFVDFTLLIHPDRGQIRHGLFRNRRKMR